MGEPPSRSTAEMLSTTDVRSAASARAACLRRAPEPMPAGCRLGLYLNQEPMTTCKASMLHRS